MKHAPTHSARWLRLLLALAALAPVSADAMGRRRAAEEERLESDYRRLDEFASANSLSEPVELGDQLYGVSNRWTSVSIATGSRRATLNGRLIWMSLPNLDLAGHPALSRLDEVKTLRPILQSEWCLPPNEGEHIVLDPGHGGNDTGARGGGGTLEKAMTLDIAKRVAAHMDARSIPWRMTRTDDRFIELPARARFAAANDARLFVSIHFNSSGNPQSSGVESFALSLPGTASTNDPDAQAPPAVENPGNRFDEANIVLAYLIQDSLLERETGVDRGVRRARFSVLRDAPCPAALVECGFLSNAEEEQRILDAGHREKIAASITDGIVRYLNAERRADILRETPPRPADDGPVSR